MFDGVIRPICSVLVCRRLLQRKQSLKPGCTTSSKIIAQPDLTNDANGDTIKGQRAAVRGTDCTARSPLGPKSARRLHRLGPRETRFGRNAQFRSKSGEFSGRGARGTRSGSDLSEIRNGGRNSLRPPSGRRIIESLLHAALRLTSDPVTVLQCVAGIRDAAVPRLASAIDGQPG